MTVTVLLGLFVIPAAAADTYGLTIGGVEVTSDNLTIDGNDIPGMTGSATYDPSTSTLTLNGATVGGMIKYTGTGTLNLVLTGENTVSGGVDGTYGYGICVTSAALNISGTGSLTVTGADATSGSVGIRVGGDLTVSGGTVEATGSAATNSSFGVYASGKVIVNGGTLTVTGGTANISSVRPTFFVQSTAKETMIFTPAMRNSSGQWWANSVTWNRSEVMRAIICPTFASE